MKRFTVICCVVVACAMLPGIYYSPMPLRTLERMSSYVAYPFIRFQQVVIDRIKVFLLNHHTLHELQGKVDQLMHERDQLRASNIQLQSSVHFMNDIQELKEFNKRFESPGIIGQVMMRHISKDTHYFFLDAGANKGVMRDMAVVYNNCMVGKITEVYPWYSKVQLITDRSCKIASYCTETSIAAIHEGINDEKNTRLSFVSHLAPVQKDDLVLSSGEGMIFPRGFAIGRIASYRQEGLFYHIDVQPLLDFKQLRYCTIIPKGQTINC